MIEASPGRRSAYDRKRDAAVRECQAAGLAPGSYAPWPDRGLRRIRLRPRPPHYRGLSAVVVTMSCFAIAWTAVHAVITPDVELVWSAAIGVGVALVFGAGRLWEVRRDIGASTVCRGGRIFEMHHTLRVPRSPVDPVCLDPLIDEMPTTGKAPHRGDIPSFRTGKQQILKRQELVVHAADGPIRTFAKLAIAAAQLP